MHKHRKSNTWTLLACFSLFATTGALAQEPNEKQTVSFTANTLLESGASVSGDLTIPSGAGAGKLPAVVIIHSAGGYEDLTRRPYVQSLNQAGIATLELNLFSRGNRPKNSRMNLVHTFGALTYLAGHPSIDPDRIGILGFSHGGLLALFSSSQELNHAYTGSKQKFAAHLALYPVCWAHLASVEGKNAVYPSSVYSTLTGAPVHILAAEKDAYDAPDSCQKFIVALPPAARSSVTLTMYPDTTHGWDGTEDKSYQDPAANQGRGAYVQHVRNPAVAAQSLAFSRQFFTVGLAKK